MQIYLIVNCCHVLKKILCATGFWRGEYGGVKTSAALTHEASCLHTIRTAELKGLANDEIWQRDRFVMDQRAIAYSNSIMKTLTHCQHNVGSRLKLDANLPTSRLICLLSDAVSVASIHKNINKRHGYSLNASGVALCTEYLTHGTKHQSIARLISLPLI